MDFFYQFYLPTRVVSGAPGLLRDVGPDLEPIGAKRAGVVTDMSVRQFGYLERLASSFADARIDVVSVYDRVPQDSDITIVGEVYRQFAEARCDLVVAVGGGSVIDTAKAANILLCNGGDLRDYQGVQMLTDPLLPLVVVPTTVGTGSEVTMVAVVADRTEHRKITLVDRFLAPTLAVLDPAVTHSLPARLVATTAMDAFTHAIEAYIDVQHNPISDMWSVQAGRLIREHLPTALGGDALEARRWLQTASTMAGVAFNHSMVGIVHALAHSLGGVAKVPHGLANHLMLIEGLRSNAEVEATRILEFAALTGFVGREETSVEAAIDAIAEFRDAVTMRAGLPRTLAEAGVGPDQINDLVKRALEDGTLAYNPKSVGEHEIESMYTRMMGVDKV